eukprot:1161544-Pelagomonas_calceolata.AAC.4
MPEQGFKGWASSMAYHPAHYFQQKRCQKARAWLGRSCFIRQKREQGLGGWAPCMDCGLACCCNEQSAPSKGKGLNRGRVPCVTRLTISRGMEVGPPTCPAALPAAATSKCAVKRQVHCHKARA